jgi:hypothetical protein
VSENSTIPPPPPPPRHGFDWERILIAALGVTAMVAGGLLVATPAGVPLIAAGGGIVGWTVPYRRRRR